MQGIANSCVKNWMDVNSGLGLSMIQVQRIALSSTISQVSIKRAMKDKMYCQDQSFVVIFDLWIVKKSFIWKSILDFNKETTPNGTTIEGCIFGPKICGTTTDESVLGIENTNKPEIFPSSQNGAFRLFQSIEMMILLTVLYKLSETRNWWNKFHITRIEIGSGR